MFGFALYTPEHISILNSARPTGQNNKEVGKPQFTAVHTQARPHLGFFQPTPFTYFDNLVPYRLTHGDTVYFDEQVSDYFNKVIEINIQ